MLFYLLGARTFCDSGYTNTRHSMCKFIEDVPVSDQMYNILIQNCFEITTVVSRKQNQCCSRCKKLRKNHPLDVAKKFIETYSSSNAAAQDPEEKVQLINIQYKINTHTKITNEKENRANTTTDGTTNDLNFTPKTLHTPQHFPEQLANLSIVPSE